MDMTSWAYSIHITYAFFSLYIMRISVIITTCFLLYLYANTYTILRKGEHWFREAAKKVFSKAGRLRKFFLSSKKRFRKKDDH